MTQKAIELLLKELLKEHFPRSSSFRMLKADKINSEQIKTTFEYLRSLRFDLKQIAVHPNLLWFRPEILQKRYDNLISLGITPTTSLLGRSTKTIQKNYESLAKFGIRPKKIVKCSELLGMSYNTIQSHYDNLKRLKIKPNSINVNAKLLTLNPETVINHYNNLISLGIRPNTINNYYSYKVLPYKEKLGYS